MMQPVSMSATKIKGCKSLKIAAFVSVVDNLLLT